MKGSLYAFLLVFAVMLLGGHAFAHHSFAAEFDAEKSVTLKGIQSPGNFAIVYHDNHAFRVYHPNNRPHFGKNGGNSVSGIAAIF